MESPDAAGVGFQLLEFIPTEVAKVGAVLSAPLINSVERGKITFVKRHDHFAARFKGDSILRAKSFKLGFAITTSNCLERARFVIHTRMDNSRIPTGLMLRKLPFFLEKDDLRVGKFKGGLVGYA